MFKRLRAMLWGIIALLGVIIGLTGAGYAQWQINQITAEFPKPTPNHVSAADKHYGVTVDLTLYDEVALHSALDAMQQAHLTWIRQPLPWHKIEPAPGQFDWQPYDTALTLAKQRGFHLILVLETSPAWARPTGTTPQTPPNEVTEFGRFAQAVARHFKDKVHHYQIWHEPNLSQQWGHRHVDPAEYVLLLKNAALNIRWIQPEAQIITAALAPTTEVGPLNLNEMAYLAAMYQAQGRRWFDIVGAQLYGFHLPMTPVVSDPQILSIHRVQHLRAIMEAAGDQDKPIWATAFGWHFLPEDWSGQPTTWPSDTLETQLQRTQDAIRYARANWAWLGPMIGVRWDATGLAADDPARGFALASDMIEAYQVGREKRQVATLGSYPASHPSGQYSPGWESVAISADAPVAGEATPSATLTIPFEGTRLDLKINRGAFRGYLYVTIDGRPSRVLPTDDRGRSYVVLYDPLRASDTIPIARYLADESHIAIITAEGGWGQWVISGWTVHREADQRQWQTWFTVALILAALSGIKLLWELGRHRPTLWAVVLAIWRWFHSFYNHLNPTLQIGLTVILAIGVYFAPSPYDLLCLALLGLAFILRLEAGLFTLSLIISFFLARKPLPVGAVSVLELGLWMLIAATAIRLLLYLGQIRFALSPPSEWMRGTDWAVIGLFLLSTIATLNASNFGVSMFELRTLVIGSISFYFLLRLIPWLEQGNAQIMALRLVHAFIAGAVLHAAMALYQYFVMPEQTIEAEGVRRALGYLYGSPNNLALFLGRALPMIIGLLLFRASLSRRLFYLLSLIIVSSAIILTYSKGALFITVPATLLFFALTRGGKTGWLGAGSGLILLGVVLLPIAQTERFQATFRLEPGSTTFFRLQLWQSAWQMLQDFPWTGIGLDNFLYQYRTRYILPAAWEEPNLSHPHNLFLDFGTRLGGGGIVILIWLLWQFWHRAIKTYRTTIHPTTRTLLLALMGSLIAFFLHGLIDNSYFLVDLAYTFFLCLGIVEMLREET